MKKTYYLLMLASGLLFLAQHSFAQKDSSGIYKTAVDFQQRKLSYAINCKAEKHKINPDVLFKDYKVKVRHQGITYTFRKSELYGYRDCDGKEYKFVNNAAYSILNPGELNIGVGKQIMKKKGTLRLSIRDLTYFVNYNGYSTFENSTEPFTVKWDSRVVRLSFSWRFGKAMKAINRSEGGASDEINRVGN